MRNKIPALSFSHAVLAAIFCSLIAIPAFALGDDKPATPAPTATSATSTAPALTATAAPSATPVPPVAQDQQQTPALPVAPAPKEPARRQKAVTIGSVCKALEQEFPDISISKIRYLEDQKLLTPRRTQGGYRLYTQNDIDRLRIYADVVVNLISDVDRGHAFLAPAQALVDGVGSPVIYDNPPEDLLAQAYQAMAA